MTSSTTARFRMSFTSPSRVCLQAAPRELTSRTRAHARVSDDLTERLPSHRGRRLSARQALDLEGGGRPVGPHDPGVQGWALGRPAGMKVTGSFAGPAQTGLVVWRTKLGGARVWCTRPVSRALPSRPR